MEVCRGWSEDTMESLSPTPLSLHCRLLFQCLHPVYHPDLPQQAPPIHLCYHKKAKKVKISLSIHRCTASADWSPRRPYRLCGGVKEKKQCKSLLKGKKMRVCHNWLWSFMVHPPFVYRLARAKPKFFIYFCYMVPHCLKPKSVIRKFRFLFVYE